MKLRSWLFLILVLVLVLAIFYAFQPSKTPSPQPPLVTLTSANFADSFYGALKASTGDVRLVLLVSPT